MKFESTNELRNVDIKKIMKNPDMKPKKNPIHYSFVDTYDDIISKFDISNNMVSIENGANNTVFKNNNFTLRISKRIFHPSKRNIKDDATPFNNNLHIKDEIKIADEQMLQFAVKRKWSPRVYYFGNMLWKNNIHRVCISESYDTTLAKFIKKHECHKLVGKYKKYETHNDVFHDIVEQISELIDDILSYDIIYYDLKPENIVIRYTSEGIVVKFIDWDSDFCCQESWIDNDYMKQCIKFLNYVTIAGYCYRYFNNNIFNIKIIDSFDSSMLPQIHKILFVIDSEFLTILVHYLHRILGVKTKNIEEINFREYKTQTILKNGFLQLVNSTTNRHQKNY